MRGSITASLQAFACNHSIAHIMAYNTISYRCLISYIVHGIVHAREPVIASASADDHYQACSLTPYVE